MSNEAEREAFYAYGEAVGIPRLMQTCGEYHAFQAGAAYQRQVEEDKKNLVYGIGVNDADYAVSSTVNNKLILCPFYKTWQNMLKRCYGDIYKTNRPTYSGCTVSPEWHRFSVFKRWMESQDWKDNQLDKDLLSNGNKVYRADTCVFISARLNSFTLDCGATRGEWPLGVNYEKRRNNFQATCRNPFTGKKEYIGTFTTPEEAHEAWRKRKHELACIYADMQTDERLSNALRTRYAAQEGK